MKMSWDCLISKMGTPIQVGQYLHIETPPHNPLVFCSHRWTAHGWDVGIILCIGSASENLQPIISQDSVSPFTLCIQHQGRLSPWHCHINGDWNLLHQWKYCDKGSFYLLAIWSNRVQYIPRNMHTVFALLCFVVVIHWLIFPYPSGLFHWHCGNLTIAPVPAKQPWWI